MNFKKPGGKIFSKKAERAFLHKQWSRKVHKSNLIMNEKLSTDIKKLE